MDMTLLHIQLHCIQQCCVIQLLVTQSSKLHMLISRCMWVCTSNHKDDKVHYVMKAQITCGGSKTSKKESQHMHSIAIIIMYITRFPTTWGTVFLTYYIRTKPTISWFVMFSSASDSTIVMLWLSKTSYTLSWTCNTWRWVLYQLCV